LVADLVRGLGGDGRALRVDDQLDLAGVVAKVDEDEPAVVAACVGPAGDRDAAAGVVGPQLAAHRVAPAHPSRSSSSAASSTSPPTNPPSQSPSAVLPSCSSASTSGSIPAPNPTPGVGGPPICSTR